MKNSIILRFDGGNFVTTCIDGFKAKIKKENITLKEIKLIKDTMNNNGCYVENFMIIDNDILEIEGYFDVMPNIEDISDLIRETREAENELVGILHSIHFLDIEIAMYVSGLY
ncbi:hypothetical protein [Clostridium sp.]